jgi:hypothetical protein
MTAATQPMTCGVCRRRFEEDRGQAVCRGCPLHAGCRFVRCPHCGFENPVEPPWLLSLRRWLAFDEAR